MSLRDGQVLLFFSLLAYFLVNFVNLLTELACFDWGLLIGIHASRVDPSTQAKDAIARAGENGHANVVELLLADPRVDPLAEDEEGNQAVEC